MPDAEPTTPEAVIAALDEKRAADLAAIHSRVTELAPGMAVRAKAGLLSYGTYGYRYASGREGTWSPLSVAATKAGLSIYAPPTIHGDDLSARFPRADVGRGCVRVKRLAEVDPGALDELIREAAAIDGKHVSWSAGDASAVVTDLEAR